MVVQTLELFDLHQKVLKFHGRTEQKIKPIRPLEFLFLSLFA
jgi:hypothetical protein